MSPNPSRRPFGDDIVGSRRDLGQALGPRRLLIRAPRASVPSAALVVDHHMITPFGPAGLGLVHVDRWSEYAAPLPTVSELALDLSAESAIELTYLVYSGDREAPLALWGFPDTHPAAWLSALAGDHALLVVGDSAVISKAQTPAATTRALTDVWAGIIGCSDTCVVRAAAPHKACRRHSLRQSPSWSVVSGL